MNEVVDNCGCGIAEVQRVQQKPMQSGEGQSMRPARDEGWVHTSAARLQVLIAQVLPPLAAHPRMAVRTALAQGQPAALNPVLYLPLLLTLYARPVSHGRLVSCQKVFTERTVPLLTLRNHMRCYTIIVQAACIAAATGQARGSLSKLHTAVTMMAGIAIILQPLQCLSKNT